MSDAVYALAAYLQRKGIREPMAVDWGIARSVQLLTRGEVNPEEIFDYTQHPGPDFKAACKYYFRDPGRRYIFHAPEATAFAGHFQRFLEAAREAHKQVVLEASFYQRDGTPVFHIYRVEEQPPVFSPPPDMQPREATLGGLLRLLGYRLGTSTARPGDPLDFELYWQASQPIAQSFTVFTHLIREADGQLWGQMDHPPVYGSYPTTRWLPGEVVADPYRIQIPENAPPGIYQIRVGMYDPTTGERLPIDDPQHDAEGNSLMLVRIQVTP